VVMQCPFKTRFQNKKPRPVGESVRLFASGN